MSRYASSMIPRSTLLTRDSSARWDYACMGKRGKPTEGRTGDLLKDTALLPSISFSSRTHEFQTQMPHPQGLTVRKLPSMGLNEGCGAKCRTKRRSRVGSM